VKDFLEHSFFLSGFFFFARSAVDDNSPSMGHLARIGRPFFHRFIYLEFSFCQVFEVIFNNSFNHIPGW